MVQLVRTPPCHGGGRGFESHPGRYYIGRMNIMLRSPKFTYIIRIIAAAYIVYLAVSLIGEIQKGAVTGGMFALGVIGIIAFLVFSVWAVISGVKGLMADEPRRADEEQEAEEEVETEEEEKARIIAAAEGTTPDNSLFARMQRLNSEPDEEAEDTEETEDTEEKADTEDKGEDRG